jgi:hypothetical protein
MATCTVSYSVAVGHSVVATYSGSSSFAGSTSTAVTESVRPWTLTITADDQTIDFGQAVPTFTYTVGGLMGGDALTTPPTCGGSGGISIGTYPIVCSDASAGSNYTINYVSGTLVVNRAATSVSETADVNPTVTGQPVTITATVAAVNSSATPTGGTVEFSVAGTDLPGCANVALSARAATCTLTNGLAAGSFTIAASYGGSSDFAPSQSEDGALTEQVNPAATTTVLTVDHTAVVTGQSLSLTATIAATAPGRSTAGGIGSTVTFQADGINLPGCAAVAVSSSRAVCAVPAGFTMSHTITAAYSGDANFTASTATPLAETVAPADTSVALAATPNPAVQKQPVTYSATISVTAPGDGAPSGTVAFSDEAGAIADCASALVSTSAPYVATCSATAGDVGTEAITATYSGDSAFNGSTGQTSVTFNPGSPATIEISPTSATLAGWTS